MTDNIGTFYGIGVGPGDPDLITLKAVKVLKFVDTVFTASSAKNSYSIAINIAKSHIPDNADIRSLPFPMTSDKEVAQKAWDENAAVVIKELEKGRNAAFLTLGDPMTYSTFSYLMKHVQDLAPNIKIETIPGITSYQAAAARLNTPLVEAEESLFITSGAYGGEKLKSISNVPDSVVMLKAYKNVKDIGMALKDTGLFDTSVAISKCGRDDENIIYDISELMERKPDYWTLIISKKPKNITE